MITTDYIRLMAAYSHWQNRSLLEAADSLTDAERRQPRGAFFGSIHGTLNHLLWGDQAWLQRLADRPPDRQCGIAESNEFYPDWSEFCQARAGTDQFVLTWADRVQAADLAGELSWFSAAIQADVTRPRAALVVHFYNHGTHHRGQVHAMLTATGAKPAATDIPFMPDAHYQWPHGAEPPNATLQS